MMDGDVAIGGRTISLDADSAERLSRLCAEGGRTAEEVIRDALLALEGLIEEETSPPHVWTAEDDAAMREAIAEFERDEGIPHEQVMAEARALVGE